MTPASPVRNNLSVKSTTASTTTLASNNLYPEVVCVNIPANPCTNLNHTYSIGPVRNPLKPYNHIAAVRAASSWDSRASTNAPLISFHRQLDRTARSNYDIPSSRKHTPPRSAHPIVQTILTKFAKVQYNASHLAHKVPLNNWAPRPVLWSALVTCKSSPGIVVKIKKNTGPL